MTSSERSHGESTSADGGLSPSRLARMDGVLRRHVDAGDVPGLVALVSRRGATHVTVHGARSRGGAPMTRDSIFRISSMTKPMTAAAAMVLVEECTLGLDEPVDPFLPELANRRVLARLDGPLSDTVPAKRSITLRDLLTLRIGFGHVLSREAQSYPIVKAAGELGILHGPPKPQGHPPADEWLRRLGTLPLMHQPGELWMYDLGLDVLGVLIARASGQSLGAFLRSRIFEPLGMRDTGFHVPQEARERFTESYAGNAAGTLDVYDSVDGDWSTAPPFEQAAAGLVSTADDVLAFQRMLLNGGRGANGGPRILARSAVAVMTSDQLVAGNRAGADIFFGQNSSWGFGMSVITRRDSTSATPGRFGWDGGLGTSAWSDPAEGLVGILMTQVFMGSPKPPSVFRDFWTGVYQAIDD